MAQLTNRDLFSIAFYRINKSYISISDQVNIIRVIYRDFQVNGNIEINIDSNKKKLLLKHIKIEICYRKDYLIEYNIIFADHYIKKLRSHEVSDFIQYFGEWIKTVTIQLIYNFNAIHTFDDYYLMYIKCKDAYQCIDALEKHSYYGKIRTIYDTSLQIYSTCVMYFMIDGLFQYLNNQEIFNVLEAIYPVLISNSKLFTIFLQHIREISNEFQSLSIINTDRRLYNFDITNYNSFYMKNCSIHELSVIIKSIGCHIIKIALSISSKNANYISNIIDKYCKRLELISISETKELISDYFRFNENIKLDIKKSSQNIETTLSSQIFQEQLIRERFTIDHLSLIHLNEVITEQHFEEILKLRFLKLLEINASYTNIKDWNFIRKLNIQTNDLINKDHFTLSIDGMYLQDKPIENFFDALNDLVRFRGSDDGNKSEIVVLKFESIEICNYILKKFYLTNHFQLQSNILDLYNCEIQKNAETNNILTHFSSIWSLGLYSTIFDLQFLCSFLNLNVITLSKIEMINNEKLLKIYTTCTSIRVCYFKNQIVNLFVHVYRFIIDSWISCNNPFLELNSVNIRQKSRFVKF